MQLSIVIPTLNEAETLGQALERITVTDKSAEIIVIDGGSHDGTVRIARQYTPHVLTSQRGRGPQQDKGARHSHGSVLLFLHADTQLPTQYQRLIRKALEDPDVIFGAFYLKFHPSSPGPDLIAFMANLRSRFLRLPYGDQALFVRRDGYFQVGGFQDWPIMEDVDLVRRLNRVGDFKLARGYVRTSSRRWKTENLIFATLRNWSLMIRYFWGVPPHALARYYSDTR